MKHIWIVEQSSSFYEDALNWPVKAFHSKESAEAWIAENQPLFLLEDARRKQEAVEWQEKFKHLRNSMCPWAYGAYTYPDIYYIAIEEMKAEWGDKAVSHEHEEWGYSLVEVPIELLP